MQRGESGKMELIQEHTIRKISARVAENFMIGTSSLHWHQNCEICILLSNQGNFRINGELVAAKQGDILIIDEYVAHQFIISEPKTNIAILHLCMDCFTEQQVPFRRIKPHITKAEIDSIPGLSERISFLVDTLCNETSISQSPKENPFMHSIAASLYYLLMRHFKAPEDTAKEKAGRKEFYQIAEYINANFKSDMTVNSISSKLFTSRKKVSETFRSFSGMSINDYVNMLRVKNANYLLLHGAEISEAAFDSGFQSLRTFNHIYKKLMGISPTEYIKRGGNISESDPM